MTRIKSEVRGPGLISPVARLEYRALVPGQVLLLLRERDNAVDPNAIIATTLLGQPCGYVAKEHAARVAPELDQGIPWRCKVKSKANAFRCPEIVLWRR